MIYYLIYPFAFIIGNMPRVVQYGLSDLVGWALYRVFRYRVKVVRENLSNSFPDYSLEQRRSIERKFYRHLGDIFTEILTFPAISINKFRKRMVFTNSEQLEQETEGKSVIVMMAHFGSWEYGSTYGLHSRHEAVYGVYKPLRSKGFDYFFLKCRSRCGSTPIPMADIAQTVFQKRNSEKGVVVALIADQSPPRYDNVPWFDFLHQPTQFFTGGERLATKMHMPVYIAYVDKVSRGRYVTRFEKIYDGVEKLADFEIMRRYAQRLEEMIIERPELWMWSHRRWKRKPLNDEHKQ